MGPFKVEALKAAVVLATDTLVDGQPVRENSNAADLLRMRFGETL